MLASNGAPPALGPRLKGTVRKGYNMDRISYSVERVLQLVRTSFNESLGELSQKVFFQRLWSKLDSLNDPGVVKPSTTPVPDGTISVIRLRTIYRQLPMRDSSIL